MQINLDDFIKKMVQETEEKKLSLEIAKDNFFKYLDIQNKRQQTVLFYQCALKGLYEYFYNFNIEYTNQVTDEVINRYIKYAQTIQKIKNTTINKKIVAIKYLLKVNAEYGYIPEPKLKVKKLESDEARFEIVSKKDIDLILNNLERWIPQYQLIFRILLETGIRRTELTYIKTANIDFTNNSIFLEHTKNKQKRYCFVSDKTITLIKKQDLTHEYLLTGKKGTHIPVTYVDEVFRKIKKDLNIECLSPHKLRHTFATNLDKNNIDFETMRILLGHSDYSMLKKYIHKQNEKLRDVSITINSY